MRFTPIFAAAALLSLTACQIGNYHTTETSRTIRANVVALDQPITYNRFGSFNPYGMIYALENDVEPADKHAIGKSTCPNRERVRLKDDVRPRPLVLRGNQGDRLQVRFTNRLMPSEPGYWGPTGQPNMSKCTWHDVEPAEWPAKSDQTDRYNPYPNNDYGEDHGNHTLKARREAIKEEFAEETGRQPTENEIDQAIGEQDDTNWPRTRTASFVVSGMTAVRGVECEVFDANSTNKNIWHDASDPRVTGIQPIPPGACFIYEYALGEPGTHLFFSLGAPSGGQGDGGSLVHGLFGSVNVQHEGSVYYRSQVTEKEMTEAKRQARGKALINFQAKDQKSGVPLLNMLQPAPSEPGVYDLVHGDLNAIIVDCDGKNRKLPRCRDNLGNKKQRAFREFTVIFHDELKTFYPEPIKELGEEYQLEGIGDGFAINYGASGMGSILLANRKGFGPAKDCLECLYEEFFLQSWANGDPALLPAFEDDPSNVHHSYLGDRVEFRNLHAGPKETHVFHLHAHQWLAQRDDPEEAQNFGTYLDSQTIAPHQGFAYEIYYGGSGNRNQTPGDSIFHCHLYPHFAQGMWALWRVHDVFEDGSRRLPDGELGGGTDHETGITEVDAEGEPKGTPIPAIVPLPKQAMPPAPTYVADVGKDEQAMPGYPFYIAGRAGHRAPQPPLDFVEYGPDDWSDGGLPRHVFTGEGERTFGELHLDPSDFSPDKLVEIALRTGDFSAHLEKAEIDLLDNEGEPIERAAMDFHAGKAASFKLANGMPAEKPYESITPEGKKRTFIVNNAPPKPGAPFADPCKADPDGRFGPNREVRYDVSAIQLDLIVNKAGWHDPQARINVLTEDAPHLEGKTTGDAEPFFFRANSRDCIEFRHENRTPKDLELDDFQVKTPTDTIGQHIHLVKFDVTSSDGSGNGWNYEDGTLAPDEVRARIEAAKKFTDEDPNRGGDGDQLTLPGDDEETIQTTVQRWYADPLLSGEGGTDRTIRTVFTHDHFAPSSIQHHGFYSALLVEPEGSTWRTADGTVMCPEQIVENLTGETCESPVVAVGAHAIITDADDPKTHPDHREFAMAIADFGLLYEPRHETDEERAARETGEQEGQGLDHLLASLDDKPIEDIDSDIAGKAREKVDERRDIVRSRYGVPVDPPLKPESISKNHHNPYLVNYRNEPLPLRIGKNGPEPTPDLACDDTLQGFISAENETGVPAFADSEDVPIASLRNGRGWLGANRPDGENEPPDGWAWLYDRDSIDEQRPGVEGDMANVFSTRTHGDPCTPIIEAYVGETVQLRMIQGAQEVQHMFEVQGMSWPREVANEKSPKVAAQEIGISEHFEMKLPATSPALRTRNQTDYLYRFSTVDDLWNGAWGLMRAYERSDVRDPVLCGDSDSCDHKIGKRLAAVTTAPVSNEDGPFAENDPLEAETCPLNAPVRFFVVDAVTVKDVLGRDENGDERYLRYNADHSIADWDALALMPVHATTFGGRTVDQLNDLPEGYHPRWTRFGLDDDREIIAGSQDKPLQLDQAELEALLADIRQGRREARGEIRQKRNLEPLALRARAGECVIVRLNNLLLHDALEDGSIDPDNPATDKKGDVEVERKRVVDNDCVSAEDHDSCAGVGNAHLDGENGYDPRHLPRIVKMNAIELQASSKVGITPQRMHFDVYTNGGAVVGRNSDREPQFASSGGSMTYVWYAGEMTVRRTDEPSGKFVRDWSCHDDGLGNADDMSCQAIGPVNLVSLADVIEHGQQGLIGALVVEEADAIGRDPLTRAALDMLPNGTRAFIDPGNGGEPFHEFVLMYQDGLNLRWQDQGLTGGRVEAVPDCLVCDDSYDRGEKGVNYRTEPFWARLNKHPTVDLNGEVFPDQFFLEEWEHSFLPKKSKPIATPGFEVKEGEAVTFHVLQPYGRARQRAFMVLGQDYQDLLPYFGSPHSALISVGKAATAKLNSTNPEDLGKPAPGKWIWRDGPAQHFSSGVWGKFEVEAE